MEPYITLLSTPDYLPGVIGLARSLRATGTSRPLLVALSDGIGPEVQAALEREQLPTLQLPPALRPDGLDGSGAEHSRHWQNTFDKLHLFGLVQFRKLVYLDSDMMVLSNIDELFDRPHMSAVAAGRLVHPDWVRLNSGLMVIEPQAGLPAKILGTREAVAREVQAGGGRAVGDQDLINAYYAEWPRSHLQLDEAYNVLHPYVDHYVASGRYKLEPAGGSPRARAIKVIHFIGSAKPWSLRGLLRHLTGLWRSQVPPLQRETFRMYRTLLRGSAAAWA